jgi:hypothetical protein
MSDGALYRAALHEMGHVLGIGSLWKSFKLVSGVGTTNPMYVGANALAAYNQIFGTNASGIPVENTGGAGTAGVHWRESKMDTELMTSLADASMPLSRITIGSLADMGYKVNYAAADYYTKPVASMALAAMPDPHSMIAASFYNLVEPPIAAPAVNPFGSSSMSAGPGELLRQNLPTPLRRAERASQPAAARVAVFDSWGANRPIQHLSDDDLRTVARSVFDFPWSSVTAEVLRSVIG